MTMAKLLRPFYGSAALSGVALMLAALWAGTAHADVPVSTTEYDFVGTCAAHDCTGDGVGHLRQRIEQHVRAQAAQGGV